MGRVDVEMHGKERKKFSKKEKEKGKKTLKGTVEASFLMQKNKGTNHSLSFPQT